jgi:subtilisin-like proprotein convertase family protein
MNGTWKLYVADQGNGGSPTVLTWSLTFVVTGSNAPTTTNLNAASFSPSFTTSPSNAVTLSGTVVKTSDNSNVTGGTVTIHDNTTNTDIGPGSVNGGAFSIANVTFSTIGSHDLVANYSGTTGFASSSSGHVSQLVTVHATNPNGTVPVTGNSFCFNASDTLNQSNVSGGQSIPYPVFLVLGETINGNTEQTPAGSSIQQVTLTLNNLQAESPEFTGIALGYTANATVPNPSKVFELFSWADGSTSSIGSGITLTLADTGTTGALPANSRGSCSTCLPTDNFNQVGQTANSDTIPNPAGGNFTVDSAAPEGTSTFTTEFGGKAATGVWSLYVLNRASSTGSAGTLGSWCLNFTMGSGHPTQTVLTASPNPLVKGASGTVTATVTTTDNSGTPNAGSVSFVDGATSLGTVSVNSSGVAQLTITNGVVNGVTLTDGTHHIIATYSGTNTGNPQFGVSTGTLDLRVNTATTETGTQPYVYCNPATITAPGFGDNVGPADVYPSNITVTNLPGTIKGLTVTLNGFTTNDQNDLLSLLVGPGGANMEFFAQTGSICGAAPCFHSIGPINVTFDDTAAGNLNGVDAANGNFQPTSLNTSQKYPACPTNAPDCLTANVGPPLSSNPFTPANKATTAGSAKLGNPTAAGVFGGTTASTANGNALWSLYLDQTGNFNPGRTSTANNGWCLNFTQNAPDIDLTVTPMTVSPNPLKRGSAASFTVTVTNHGPGPTGLPTITVTDTLPTGLSFTGFTSTDPNWSCSNNGQLVTCLYGTAQSPVNINAGNSTSFTINASVGTGTADTISNTATLTAGTGGDASPANDSTSVTNIPVVGTILSISKTHTGNFTQGQSGTYSLTVTNTGANGLSTGVGATHGTIQVTDSIPNGLTITAVSGGTGPTPPWNCSQTPPLAVNCTLSAASLAVGSTTPAITVTVSVANNAEGPLVNTGILTATTDQIGVGDPNCVTNQFSCVHDSTNITQVPTQMTANTGTTPQSAAVNTAFANALAVTVKDAGNVAVAGVSVTFTAPGSAATGSFAAATGCTASACTITTNSSGVATASTFTANGTIGSYNVHTTSPSLSPTVDFALTNTDTPATVSSVSSTLANGSYTVGQVIPITVTFSKAVNVTGTPQLALNSGGTASYSSGSGTATLTFTYTVASGQNANPLDEASAAALTLNGGTIQNLSTQAATLTLPAPGATGALGVNKSIIVDTIAPTVTGVSSTNANGTYGVGASIAITVAFSEVVNVTGTPQLGLNSAGTANYTSGSGTNTLTFTYTVASGQSANPLDEASTTALTLNGGTIKDAATNAATLTLPAPGTTGSLGVNKSIVIDTTAPSVSGVSSTTANGTYGVGSVIAITVTFGKPVVVTGTPQLALNSGGTASYSSGSGTATLTFTYTVAAGQNAKPLDEASATALTLNGGTIKDSGGNPATLTVPAPGTTGALGVNKSINVDTTAPTVTAVTSTTANGTYGVGSVITITVTFGKPVVVTGTPQLALNSGGTASYSSGSGTSTLTFTYTVGAGQNTPKLDYTSTTALTLNGGTIFDTITNPNAANLTLPAPGSAGSIGGTKSIVIDTTAPTVTAVTSTTANGTYGVAAVITITVSFSKPVVVTGTPLLALNSGGTASYSSGSGTSTLTFTYTVGAGQNSPKLDYTSTTALSLNGGTIFDTITNPNAANLTLPAPGSAGSIGGTKSIVINTSGPPPQVTVTNVTSTTANGTYGVGSVITITVTFSNTVNVTGTPQLALNSGGTASYSSGSGTSTLTFTYTVGAGQNSSKLDYTSTTALTLNSGTINDTGNNPASLTLPSPGAAGSLGANKSIVIDTVSPSITNVSSTTANGTYGTASVITVTVTFSKPVAVTGTPLLALNSGGTASYSSGSGTSTLTFIYTVAAGQNSPHLDYTSTTALTLNGGTIFDTDVNPNAANLTLPSPGAAGSLSANTNIVISTSGGQTTVTNVSSTTPNGTYGTGATIAITVTFSGNVTVTGTPQLALNSGGTANYSSGSGGNTLTFTYLVGAGQNSPHLDYTSTTALTLNGGSIVDSVSNPASLTLPSPGAAGSLSANTNIAIDTSNPAVVSYSVVFGTNNLTYNLTANSLTRKRLPWQITEIQVVFSKPISSADVNSLTGGVTTTGFSGLGTNTLTWTITPIAVEAVSTMLAGTGPDAIKDVNGNPLAGGNGFTQNFKVLWGDYNDDGVVNTLDVTGVGAVRLSGLYNILADLNGDGVVDVNDVTIARTRIGTVLP